MKREFIYTHEHSSNEKQMRKMAKAQQQHKKKTACFTNIINIPVQRIDYGPASIQLKCKFVTQAIGKYTYVPQTNI